MAKATEQTIEAPVNGQQALQLAESPSTPMQMLALAVSQNADIDKLTKLMDLQERWEKNEARKAFVEAMNAFKVNPPTIRKNKHVRIETAKGVVEYDHATLDHVCDQVTKELGKYGVTHRWKLKQTDQLIEVTCVLTHELGYSEETTLSGGPDATGLKNSIQQISSTVTYLQRYTLLAACGLAAENADDDGRAAGLPGHFVLEQVEWINNASSLDELQKLFKDAYKQAAAAKDQRSMKAFIEAKDRRKADLS